MLIHIYTFTKTDAVEKNQAHSEAEYNDYNILSTYQNRFIIRTNQVGR